MHVDGIPPGAKVLLVDDLLATGGTMRAGCSLIESAGGVVVGCGFPRRIVFPGGPGEIATL